MALEVAAETAGRFLVARQMLAPARSVGGGPDGGQAAVGWCVLPILFRDRLVGRIEPRIDGAEAACAFSPSGAAWSGSRSSIWSDDSSS